MNNNRINRRRGRGSRNQSGGGNNANRIDSRARGNAPQLLDKYKKLAQDAQHNGDRVQMEYYLQFADHYFRVIADNKARQDDGRTKRQDERSQSNYDDDDEDEGEDRRRHRKPQQDHRDDDAPEASEGRRETERDRDDRSFGSGGDSDEARKPRRPRRKPREEASKQSGEIDAAVLPPAISARKDGEEAPKPRRRRKISDNSDDGVQAVG